MEPMARSAAGTPFVARHEQLERFRSALGRAASGEPGAILLSGDAGVGKTRLLTRMAEVATASGALVVVSHCIDLGDVGLPYLPFAEALAQLRSLGPAVEDVIAARPALRRLVDSGTTEPPAGTAEQVRATTWSTDSTTHGPGAGSPANRVNSTATSSPQPRHLHRHVISTGTSSPQARHVRRHDHDR